MPEKNGQMNQDQILEMVQKQLGSQQQQRAANTSGGWGSQPLAAGLKFVELEIPMVEETPNGRIYTKGKLVGEFDPAKVGDILFQLSQAGCSLQFSKKQNSGGDWGNKKKGWS